MGIEAWQMQGDIIEACNCVTTCPCNFGSDPTSLPCEVILGFHIDKGRYENLHLDGLNFIFFITIPGHAFDGNWTVGVYLDERGSGAQNDALGTIISGEAGGWFEIAGALIAEHLEPEQVAISYEVVDGELRMSVPGLLEVQSERVPHPMPDTPPLNPEVSGLAVPFHTGPTFVRRASAMKLTDPKMSFEHPGMSSLVGKFDYSGP